MSKVTEMEDDLLRRARALPDEVEPGRDLWPGIESALAAPQSRPRPRLRIPLALAAVLLAGFSSLVTLTLSGAFEEPSTDPLLAEQLLLGRFGPRYVMGTDFAQTRLELIQAAEQQLAALSPEAREALTVNLEKIEQALTEINEALNDDPHNELLLHLLLSTYTDELRMLQDIHGYSRVVVERTET